MKNEVVVIGAGVVGASVALVLQAEGHKVLLIDRSEPCAGASFGNAGAIVNGSCAPTAMPGIVIDVMKMLLQADMPLSIRPSYLPAILPWLIRFIWQSRVSAVTQNANGLYNLSQHAASSWQKLTQNTALSNLFAETGWLKVYESKSTFAGTAKSRKLMDQLGSPYEVLNKAEIMDLEPNLAPIFEYGFFQKDSMSIRNPDALVRGMVDLFCEQGGRYEQFEVKDLVVNENEIQLRSDRGTIEADKIVVAAGAWSKSITRQLGDVVPLDTERGYHLMFPQETQSLLSRPVVNGESSFVLSPMQTGIRMTSQVEFAGIYGKPKYERARKLIPAAKRMLPKLKATEESAWLGFRPSLPDSLPVLSYSQNSKKVIYAFGHQHLGMTLGAVSAYAVADLVAEREPTLNLSPYRVSRF